MFPWWVFIALGGVTLIILLLSIPKVKGGEKHRMLSALAFAVAIGLIITGVLGYFLPGVLKPANKIVQGSKDVMDIREIFLSISTQAILAYGAAHFLLYKPFIKKDTSQLGVGFTFLGILLFAWTVVFFMGKFREIFVEPFVHLYHLLF